ncbi:MAG: Ig-like domain-containing protein [Spirochaetaceae bacterium]|jgi:hypothetical protein|nr:Ig-like domain-containing protein [Spirochaetaceae bacterium]
MKGFFPAVLLTILFSCDILRDFPFDVAEWSPGDGYHAPPETVSLLFTRDPDRTSVEEAFSLTEDGKALKGVFSWEGRRLVFRPAAPLEKNRDYRVVVAAEAHDDRGVSMDQKFEAPFSTRPAGDRPRILSISPPEGGRMNDLRGRVSIEFSQAVHIDSCFNAVSFYPSVGGSWTLEDQGRRAVFTPSEPWIVGTRYRISVSSGFLSVTGLALGQDYVSRFTPGDDDVPPVLIAAYALDAGGNRVFPLVPEESGAAPENPLWEGTCRVILDFSEPVDTVSLRSRFLPEPSLGLTMETPAGYAPSVIFRLNEKPAYQSRFLFKLNPGVRDEAGNESSGAVIFRIYVGGSSSKPPSLIGIRLPLVPGGAVEAAQKAVDFSLGDAFSGLPITAGTDQYPYDGSGVSTWIELYFDTAPGAELNPFSLMDLFRVDAANGAISFSPQKVETSMFTWENPRPGWEIYRRVEIRGILINRTKSGMVTFYIGSGLEDTLGNRNPAVFRLPLLK